MHAAISPRRPATFDCWNRRAQPRRPHEHARQARRSRGALRAQLEGVRESGRRQAVSSVLNNLGILYTNSATTARNETLEGASRSPRPDRTSSWKASSRSISPKSGRGRKARQGEEACAVHSNAARGRGDHLTMAGALKCRARIERERGAFSSSIASLRIGIARPRRSRTTPPGRDAARAWANLPRDRNSSDARLAWREAADSFEGLDVAMRPPK